MIRRPVAAVLVGTGLALAGCIGKDADVQPTVTKAVAAERVKELVDASAAHLPAGASLKYNDGSDLNPCDDPTDGGPAGRVFVEHRYLVIAPGGGTWHENLVIPSLAEYWRQQGYRVNLDLRSAPDPRYGVETADGYRATVTGYDRGGYYEFTLTGGSPCIWENGTPAGPHR